VHSKSIESVRCWAPQIYLKMEREKKKDSLESCIGISDCLCYRDRVSLLIHTFDVELYAIDWDIWQLVTKLHAAIEALFSLFLKGASLRVL